MIIENHHGDIKSIEIDGEQDIITIRHKNQEAGNQFAQYLGYEITIFNNNNDTTITCAISPESPELNCIKLSDYQTNEEISAILGLIIDSSRALERSNYEDYTILGKAAEQQLNKSIESYRGVGVGI